MAGWANAPAATAAPVAAPAVSRNPRRMTDGFSVMDAFSDDGWQGEQNAGRAGQSGLPPATGEGPDTSTIRGPGSDSGPGERQCVTITVPAPGVKDAQEETPTPHPPAAVGNPGP